MTSRPRLLVLAILAALSPLTASAQQPTTAPALRVEPIESGVVVAPDARFTKINDDFATLAGVYGGWLTDRTLLIGAGAYWLANRDDNIKMQYAGGLARWTIGGHRRLGFSAGALIGVGDATLVRPYGELLGDRLADGASSSRDDRFGRGRSGTPITAATLVRVNDSFFIAEPQASAIWTITNWMRLDAGVGYRVIGGANLLEDQLRGVSGSIGLQFGGR